MDDGDFNAERFRCIAIVLFQQRFHRLVVSPVDPGWGNWISTAHHTHGTWGLRYNQVVEDQAPTIQRVGLDEMADLA